MAWWRVLFNKAGGQRSGVDSPLPLSSKDGTQAIRLGQQAGLAYISGLVLSVDSTRLHAQAQPKCEGRSMLRLEGALLLAAGRQDAWSSEDVELLNCGC